jgi:hypothetical protein
MSRNRQLDLVTPEDIWKRSLLAKVEGSIPWQVYEHLSKCGVEEIFRSCRSCGDWETFYYRCSLKFCPLCNWRIARARAEMLRLWSFRIKQPKHVVLTMRNFETLTRSKIRSIGRAFSKLRRNRLWKEVRGGCVSTEITNEGRGWHLHLHIMIDCRWLDAGSLAIVWGQLLGQEFGIVKVKDCRGMDYLGEITKYVVKPAELASWKPEQIAQFVHAIRGVRFFSAFGTLFHVAREIRAELNALKPVAQPCKCGCRDFKFETEESSIIGEIRSRARR